MKRPSNPGLPLRDMNNAKRARNWCYAWALTHFVAIVIAKPEAGVSTVIIVCAIVLHLAVCIGLFRAYRLFLMHLDELQQKIQLDALAVALGVGVIAGSVSSLLVAASFISTVEIEYLVAVMMLTFAVGLAAGKRRYQ